MIREGIPDTIAEFLEARERIKDKVHMTPLLQCRSIQERIPTTNHHNDSSASTEGVNLWFKCENFQRTGSFKIRGATNAVRKSMERDPTNKKFITYSSGNHAQALALACREAGAEAHVVIPQNAPKVKARAVEGYGATLHWCKPVIEDRERTAKKVDAKIGPLSLIHPTDNRDVIAGQGSIMLEILSQLNGVIPDGIIVPVGGGGLIGGIGLAAKLLNPNIKIFGAEPLGADDAARSFAARKLLKHRDGCPDTIADGLLTTLQDRTLSAILKGVDQMFTASEEDMKRAFQLVYERMKIVIEPSAAVGVAVALHGHEEIKKCKNLVVVICGGNVQLERMAEYVPSSKL